MALPSLPLQLTSGGGDKTKQNTENIDRLYSYLQSLIDAFPNAVGQAIDPTEGFSGDGALTISDEPTDIVYTPGSGLSEDENLVGHIDIAYTKPRFATAVLIQYRQVGVDNFSSVTDTASPSRLSNLSVGTEYEVQIAGESANGSVGPFSPLTVVTIDATQGFAKAPADAQYWLSEAHTRLPDALVVSGEAGVVDVDLPTATIGIEVNGIANAKLAQMPANTIHGNNTGGAGDVLNLTGAQARAVILGSADTGWSTTNVTPDKVYDANATTTDELADVLGTLIATLITKGVLSA